MTLEPLVVPVRCFANRASGAAMNPADWRAIDRGQSVRRDAFEASTGAILYEFDIAYRRVSSSREEAAASLKRRPPRYIPRIIAA